MTKELKLEGAGLFVLFIAAYAYLGGGWGLFLGLFFVPDVSFLFYLLNTRVGAVAYNLTHHQGLFGVLAVGFWFANLQLGVLICIVALAHSAFDRMLGYGLKFPDSFQHTHLGWIGKAGRTEAV